MLKDLKKKSDGFTIIEVLIVLAIAGLIMVIVFLAVPALQRNNRNTSRDSDAARIAGAVNECVANNNGQTTNCGLGTIDGQYITLADNQQLTSSGGPSLTAATVAFSTVCDSSGTGTMGGDPRSFTVTYQVETSGAPVTQCIGG